MTPRNRTVRTAIIGAGFGGLAVALKLERAGHRDFVVLEEADGVGGTWHANTYPGVACDAPSHIYSYSFAPGDWSRRFAPGDEIAHYLRDCVEDGGIADRVQLNAKVDRAEWVGSGWRITLTDGSLIEAQMLVVATGQLRVPKIPELPGLADFDGPAFHTARWDHEVALDGKRVAVIGTGASAVQVVPEVAQRAAQTLVFQRSAHYVLPKPDGAYGAGLRRLYRRVPLLPRLARGAIWTSFEIFGLFFWKWPGLMKSLEKRQHQVLDEVVDDDRTRAALTPTDRAGCKRVLISSEFHAAFNRADVELITDPIERVTSTGVVTSNSEGTTEHPVDVIVFGTGFKSEAFADGITIVGAAGRTLHDTWEADGISAHLGISVADFPNLFLIYGPNTNLGSGSIIYMLEAQADHVVAAHRFLDEQGASFLDVRREAQLAFAHELRRREVGAVWQSGCRSWYLDADGNNIHNWPASSWEYRRRAVRIKPDDYLVGS